MFAYIQHAWSKGFPLTSEILVLNRKFPLSDDDKIACVREVVRKLALDIEPINRLAPKKTFAGKVQIAAYNLL